MTNSSICFIAYIYPIIQPGAGSVDESSSLIILKTAVGTVARAPNALKIKAIFKNKCDSSSTPTVNIYFLKIAFRFSAVGARSRWQLPFLGLNI